jgi:hypothetical protein
MPNKIKTVSAAAARRLHIAASVVAGRSITATAKELGISREWASRQANAPETRQLIVSLLAGELERVHQLFDEALKAIQQALHARRRGLSEGEVVDLGPDHYARLAAVGRLVQILTAGRPLPKPPEKPERPKLTLADIARGAQGAKRGEGGRAGGRRNGASIAQPRPAGHGLWRRAARKAGRPLAKPPLRRPSGLAALGQSKRADGHRKIGVSFRCRNACTAQSRVSTLTIEAGGHPHQCLPFSWHSSRSSSPYCMAPAEAAVSRSGLR